MAPKATERRASIFHGYGATPQDHWFGWLAEQMERVGIQTEVPALPESASPAPDAWAAAVAEAVGVPDEGSVVVAHSLGCLAVLRYLASLTGPWRLGRLVLVAGFVDTLPALPGLDGFIGDGVDPAGVGEKVGSLTVLRSDDDPYVPAGHTDRLADLLGTTALIVPGAGHFLADDGVTALPQALDALV
ncbi:alpha/beta hydrolase [Nocardiopsis sp. RSe5-2]|uniref:Alpha/beta hydrolase n=1 Tax=Nocardiopsis endophytica TaxID=3018445 RepID=A0ABT4U6G9_9ACTN|nr:alpha/beta hydrolase [Nocardiopsis endophytica]MDA2812528.1 alpha/beta hydrolase [Nocardiopsis endophytica]